MATTDTVRVAVVGMGIGKPNGRALSANPRGQVVALCDLLEERMQEFAKDLPEEVKFYTDYKQMCKDPEIDAVFVGTPNQWHVPVALEAVRNGKHVMVTKPLADSEAAAKELVAEAEAAGVVNMMSLSTRFGRDCQYLGNLQQQGYFGELYYARSRSVRRNGIPTWSLGFIQEGWRRLSGYGRACPRCCVVGARYAQTCWRVRGCRSEVWSLRIGLFDRHSST